MTRFIFAPSSTSSCRIISIFLSSWGIRFSLIELEGWNCVREKALASARDGLSNIFADITSRTNKVVVLQSTISHARTIIRGVASGHYDRPMGLGRTSSGSPFGTTIAMPARLYNPRQLAFLKFPLASGRNWESNALSTVSDFREVHRNSS